MLPGVYDLYYFTVGSGRHFMRQEKRAVKKERNYSIWFTGIILFLVYMILLNDVSEEKVGVCKSILMDRVQEVSESVLELM